MSLESAFEFFVIAIYPPLLLFLGLLGNLTGFVIFSRKKFQKLPIRNMLRYLAVLDSFYLLQIIVDYITNMFGLDIRLLSRNWCKIFTYFNYSICPIALWLLVIISIERMISITSSKLTKMFHQREFQIFITITFALYNLVIYSTYGIYFDLILTITNESNDTNETIYEYACDYAEELPSKILPLMDLFNSSIIPFSLLTIMSFYSIYFIFNSRARFSSNVESNKPVNANKSDKFKKDLKFSITLFVLNIIFLIYNLPICIANYTEVSDFTYIITLYLFYSNFATNFWIFFLFNSIFRDELLVALRIKKLRHLSYKNNS